MTTPQPQGQSAPTPSTTSAAKTGMAWYNGCSEAERARWHAAAGSAVPADAYRAFCEQMAQAAPAAPAVDADPMGLRDVGEALMATIECNADALKAAGWTAPMDCPSEIVVDLLNLLNDAKAASAVDAPDAARFRWLTYDHEAASLRVIRQTICERLPVMSYSAACTDIDAALAAQAAAKGAA